MRKITTLAAAAVLALGASGCYHATVDTGRAPNGVTVQKNWAHSFIGGLVPPSTVETASQCPNGIARVETQLSFLNQLANILTLGIYTPMTITVQCAGPTAMAEGVEVVKVAQNDGAAAITQAAERSAESGAAVLVQF